MPTGADCLSLAVPERICRDQRERWSAASCILRQGRNAMTSICACRHLICAISCVMAKRTNSEQDIHILSAANASGDEAIKDLIDTFIVSRMAHVRKHWNLQNSMSDSAIWRKPRLCVPGRRFAGREPISRNRFTDATLTRRRGQLGRFKRTPSSEHLGRRTVSSGRKSNKLPVDSFRRCRGYRVLCSLARSRAASCNHEVEFKSVP